MEMKMFVLNDPALAEQTINEWLSAQDINIIHITQSQCERQGRFVFIISLFFMNPQAGALQQESAGSMAFG